MNKVDIIQQLNTSMKTLQEGIDTHCYLVASLLESQADPQNILPLLDRCPKRPRELKLEQALKEAIEVLEESRKAFKSRKLGELRKKLTHTLLEAG